MCNEEFNKQDRHYGNAEFCMDLFTYGKTNHNRCKLERNGNPMNNRNENECTKENKNGANEDINKILKKLESVDDINNLSEEDFQKIRSVLNGNISRAYMHKCNDDGCTSNCKNNHNKNEISEAVKNFADNLSNTFGCKVHVVPMGEGIHEIVSPNESRKDDEYEDSLEDDLKYFTVIEKLLCSINEKLKDIEKKMYYTEHGVQITELQECSMKPNKITKKMKRRIRKEVKNAIAVLRIEERSKVMEMLGIKNQYDIDAIRNLIAERADADRKKDENEN